MNHFARVALGCLVGGCLIGASPSHKSPQAIRLAQPWNRLDDLTDEQTVQLDKIHRKSREEIKVIEERAKADMMAVLTAQQQAELREMQDQELADKKLKAAEKGQVEATTLPAQAP